MARRRRQPHRPSRHQQRRQGHGRSPERPIPRHRRGSYVVWFLVLGITVLGAFVAYQNWGPITSWFENERFGGASSQIAYTEPEHHLQAWELWEVYENNPVLYETSYRGKVVQIRGKIQRFEDGKVYLDTDNPTDIESPLFPHLETMVLTDLPKSSLAAVGEQSTEAICRVGKVREGPDTLTIFDYIELEMEDCIHPSEIPPAPTSTRRAQ